MRPARLSSVALLGVSALVIESCRAPTNVIVTVTTDMSCSDFKGATVAVGQLLALESTPESTESTTCDASKRIGSVVLEPSADEDGAIAFRVVGGLGRDVETCVPPDYGAGCIVARRALKYFPHDSLRVNLRLESSCAGIPCGTTETCVGGACYPATIDPNACKGAGCDDSAVTNGKAAVITTAPVRRLVQNTDYIYWGDRNTGALMRQKKTLDVPPEQIAPPDSAGADGAPNGMFLAGSEIFWGSYDGGLYHCPRDGSGTPVQLAQLDGQTVNAVVVSGDVVYFNTIYEEKSGTGELYYCSIQNGCNTFTSPQHFFDPSDYDPARLAIDANNIYWTWLSSSGDARVRYCPLSPQPCTNVVDLATGLGSPWGIVVDSTNAYWVDRTGASVNYCPLTGCSQPMTLATDQGTPLGLFVDGTTIYWTTGQTTPGQLLRCDVANCNPTVLADNQDQPWEPIVDDKYVYWCNDGSTLPGVFRLPK